MRKRIGKDERKMTRQQTVVAAAVLHRDDHPTAEMVLATARKVDPKISQATVYRNLERMAERGLIGKVTMSDGADRYDPNVTEHIHAVCDCCGRVIDMSSDLSAQAQNRAEAEAGFRACGCEITVHGCCQKCECKNRKEAK
jgi:Fe2+ or Zn2+ uptake regulation protein